ncbi:MAG: response regulator transcription factor [Chloroflexota bacterium]|nr:response regulator transcription factor [Chloroflexota bacterium]
MDKVAILVVDVHPRSTRDCAASWRHRKTLFFEAKAASGYMLKTASSSELAQAIRALKKGEPVLHPDIARKLMRGISAVAQPAAADSLTSREMQVLSLLARRLSNKEIAAELGVAEKTVKTHVSSILSKLSLESRVEAARFAKE